MAYVTILDTVCLSWSKIISNCDSNHMKKDKIITIFVIIKTCIIFVIFTSALVVGQTYPPFFIVGLVFVVATVVIDVIGLIAVYLVCAVSFYKLLATSQNEEHLILKRKVCISFKI